MDAPTISTLRDEDSPPPPATKFKVKLVVKDKPAERPAHSDDEEDDEQEIDELIDDEPAKPTLNPIVLPPMRDISPKKKPSVKRKPRKSDKDSKLKEKVAAVQPGGTLIGPTMSWFEATPSDHQQDAADMVVDQQKPKTPRKTPVPPRPKAKPKQKPTNVPLLHEDAGMLSESFAGTAASSPVTHFEANTPEPDQPMLPLPPPMHPNEDYSLEPVPIYPLPTKPFPVQPPPKIGSGFAPAVVPLDRNGRQARVRPWRVAHREIKGIAGGRWFARAWVGSRDSEFAASTAAAAALKGLESNDKLAGVAIPKLSAVSISAPPRTSRKPRAKASSSLATSAAPSRSSSVVPEISAPIRAPTKMRTVLGPPSDAGDSDMTGPPDM